jgi:hypothetical protein
MAISAHSLIAKGNLIGGDQDITLLQADLPELFCCRSLSDGLGALTVALYHGLANKKGSPLNLDQVYAVRVACERLYENPFMPFATALDLIDLVASTGLETDPPEAAILGDVFAE